MTDEEKINKLKELREQVVFIHYPHYITDKGNRYFIKDTEGTPVVGSEVQKQENGKVKVYSRNSNPNCVNGVCPIK